MSSGATTSAQSRSIGLRDLWDMIVNNDDVCFMRILPRLNQTDIKFLYDVNSETRALIKRAASSGITLKDKFKVEEMSSVSTLEFAWNNMHWGTANRLGFKLNKAWFCWQVASTNKLELLKWAREVKGCEWNTDTIDAASYQGNLEMIKYCVANGCPGVLGCCESAAHGGQLECLKYLHEELHAPLDSETAILAAESNSLHILEYLVERKYVFDDTEEACRRAAEYGYLDCLKYLHETAKAPWDAEAVRRAHENNEPDCLQYLLDNDCPLPEGWLSPQSFDKFIREGDLILVKYCVAKGFPVNEQSCALAARNGQLEILQYLHEEANASWDSETGIEAADRGYLHIFEYLVEQDYEFHVDTCVCTASAGHLNCVKYLHETAKAPWDGRAVREAHENNEPDCLQYLLDNNCPLPEGWRYEHGELYTLSSESESESES